MKALSAVIAAAALVGGVQLFHDGNGESVALEATPSNTYRLVANGDGGACAVTRGASVSDGLSLLTVAPNCRRLLPGIEQVKFWRQQNDGTVAFSADGVDPIVTFAVADGDGYESYAPALPLLSLAADGDLKPRD
ncbi:MULTISPECIES: hypothetical protein [unclassified Mesorhizobium]|uniref:hypothetical protein n=1 Tax=unclassified Mesorhizobium TaxID=325217 RepID=UPI000FEAA83B|nr:MULTISPECIES: hypothetical protein [unclassified Mesorhizobium]TGV51070.1 hypothetical protein EN784_51865 [bacterium M00.F.Ca.ET.141.01.1.1]RWC87553.1 MAG: hypothetical protein EOS72_21165 [Mesorhizobium sp.]TGQ85180.1 hypothetical protein EN851_33640 [Mesorhizobium sp. M8A.F.Ca.ET.208.01.1.1]TGT37495.1 hypothetical protein EN808_23360 [Mesorhizobium sp. M8A.F.Ca.ET.165.01.1.1]TGT47383.1 hypothetical protein EN810_33540 [Mesorhizobium sp. M8A.F.Ca.ET.167.01.1.1]